MSLRTETRIARIEALCSSHRVQSRRIRRQHRKARQFPVGVDHRLCCCGGESCRIPGRYQCEKCRRVLPWCFGSAYLPEVCDDCWDEVHAEVSRGQ